MLHCTCNPPCRWLKVVNSFLFLPQQDCCPVRCDCKSCMNRGASTCNPGENVAACSAVGLYSATTASKAKCGKLCMLMYPFALQAMPNQQPLYQSCVPAFAENPVAAAVVRDCAGLPSLQHRSFSSSACRQARPAAALHRVRQQFSTRPAESLIGFEYRSRKLFFCCKFDSANSMLLLPSCETQSCLFCQIGMVCKCLHGMVCNCRQVCACSPLHTVLIVDI